MLFGKLSPAAVREVCLLNEYAIMHVGCGAEYGGGSTYVLLLMKALREHGWKVCFASTPGLTLDAVEAAGYPVFPVPAMQREIRPWSDLRALVQLVRIIRQIRPAVVHTHTSKGGFLGRLAARMAGVPVIIHTVHGFAFHEGISKGRKLLYLNLERAAARWCDRIISVNNEDRLQALSCGIAGPDKIVTIYNGIDTTPFDRYYDRNEIRREFGAGDSNVLVGMVARLAPSKAPLDFILAAHYVLDYRNDVKFVLVGDGPLRKEIEKAVRELDRTGAVFVIGHRTDVPALLSAMDIFVMTTLWEGLPIAVLEAMAMRKPVVATDVRGPREVVRHGETGYLVPPKSPIAVGKAVLELIDRVDQAKEMGLKGRRLVEEVFNISTMTERTINVYEETLMRKKLDMAADSG